MAEASIARLGIEAFDAIRAGVLADRSQFFKDRKPTSPRIQRGLSAKLVKNSTLKVYPGFSHGMCTVNKDRINPDLLAFIEA